MEAIIQLLESIITKKLKLKKNSRRMYARIINFHFPLK